MNTPVYHFKKIAEMANITIPAGASALSPEIDLSDKDIRGYPVLYVAVAGDGTLKVEALQSMEKDNANFPYLESVSDLITGFTKLSGPNGDGRAYYQVKILPLPWLKLHVTETGGISEIIVSLIALMVQ